MSLTSKPLNNSTADSLLFSSITAETFAHPITVEIETSFASLASDLINEPFVILPIFALLKNFMLLLLPLRLSSELAIPIIEAYPDFAV